MSLNTVQIAKFGGTSVADYAAMARCAHIVADHPGLRCVVVSAQSGVTNYLVKLTQEGLAERERELMLKRIAQVERQIASDLPRQVQVDLNTLLDELEALSMAPELAYRQDLKDELLAFGERMSSRLLVAVLHKHGVNAELIDARHLIKTDSRFGQATPVPEAIADAVSALDSDTLYVTQGFIGSDEQGRTTTLGRGGSDYSAALLAEAWGANGLYIWTDVVGIYTTDPRLTEQARPIKELSFDEAAELATFGAKVLHPATLVPAIRANIPVFVGSSREPAMGGTWIRHRIEEAPNYRALALRRNQTLLTVKSPQMLHASGFLARVFGILAAYQLSVDLITTSEISVAMTLDTPPGSVQKELSEEVIASLSEFCEVSVESGLCLVAVIGNRLTQTNTRVLEVMSPFDVRLICHGASEHNLCFLLPEDKATQAIAGLHGQLLS